MASDEIESERPRKGKKAPEKHAANPAMLIGRIALWVVMALALVVAVIEFQTRRNYNATLTKLQPLMDQISSESQHTAVTQDDVDKAIVGRPAVVRGSDKNRIDTYTWRFVLKTFTVRVQYGVKTATGSQEVISFPPDDPGG